MSNRIESLDEIGGTQLLEHVVLDKDVVRAGKKRHIILGFEHRDFFGLAICQLKREMAFISSIATTTG